MKTCSKCQQAKSLADFYVGRAECKSCKRAAQAAFQQTPEWKVIHRRAKLKYRYGISEIEWQTALVEQGNKCRICKTAKPGGRWNSWATDHDHATGRFRGLLCARCNNALGWYEDNAAAVMAYLTIDTVS